MLWWRYAVDLAYDVLLIYSFSRTASCCPSGQVSFSDRLFVRSILTTTSGTIANSWTTLIGAA